MIKGLERWNKIKELHDLGMTYDQIAVIIGLASGTAVRVWVSRNKKKYDNVPDNSVDNSDNVSKKKTPEKKRTKAFDLTILNIDIFLDKLKLLSKKVTRKHDIYWVNKLLSRIDIGKKDGWILPLILDMVRTLGSDNI